MKQDHYEVLGVISSASQEEIKVAYLTLIAKYHPDLNKNNRGAELKSKQLNAAFAVLGDVYKRKQYDDLTFSPQADEDKVYPKKPAIIQESKNTKKSTAGIFIGWSFGIIVLVFFGWIAASALSATEKTGTIVVPKSDYPENNEGTKESTTLNAQYR